MERSSSQLRTNSAYSLRSFINPSMLKHPPTGAPARPGLELSRTFLRTLSNRSTQLEIVCEILRVYNCRISEVLNASYNNYYKNSFLILQASKHSRDVIVRDRLILKQIDKLKRTDELKIFSSVNYHSVYSYLKKNFSHLYKQFKTKKNYKVTHAFRYANVAMLNSIEQAQSVLNHNSKKSCLYYNKKLVESKSLPPKNSAKKN